MPAAAMLRLLSAGSYQVPALRPEEEEPDGGLHRVNLIITAFRFASLHLLIFVTNSFLYLSGCSGTYQERVRKEAGSFRGCRQDLSSSSSKSGTIWCRQISSLLSGRQHKCGARGP